MRESETIKTLDDEIRRLKDEINQLERAKRVLKKKNDGAVY